ncbi:unnamed protein product [Didymodactylos carnosus]|uniref:Uncharacterized protein n=1 Tax=Didymodactylos carnosus TaxID=1234261 RepID=A0A8S2F2K9_9BILA|nr:unnamed protein product [Didymodactylos carnosus]CAF4186730.1 unnamed protein product [Didymodactylos carnosus]
MHLTLLNNSTKRVEDICSESYITEVIVNRKNAEQRSVLEDANVLAVRKTLATGDKILINGEADSFLENMGVFNGKTSTAEGGGLFCKAFDGMTDSTRQTGSTNHTVTNAKSSMLACTTGCRFSENLQKFLRKTGFEGMFNRILYYVLKKRNAVRPQDKRPDLKMHHQPSLTHIFLGVHHFGDCTTKRKSDVLATSTSSNKPSSSSLLKPLTTNGPFTLSTITNNEEDEDDADPESAYYYVFNKCADQVDGAKCKSTERHIQDIYAKASDLYPRLCVIMQIFRNVCKVLESMGETSSY